MMKTLDFNSFKTVLLVKPRAIGDVLLATPVIHNLRQQYPHLSIDFLCEKFAGQVVSGNPFVREVITFDKRNDSTLSVINRVRRRKYDVVIDLFCNPRTAFITRWSGAKYRVGFPFRGRSYAYNIHVPPRGGEVHNVDFNLDVLRHFNIAITDSRPVFPLGGSDLQMAGEWFKEQGISTDNIVGVNPGGGWYTKKWDTGSYARLSDRIILEDRQKVLFFWGPGEFDDVQKIRSQMKQRSEIIPKTTLKEMGAFLKMCSSLISNDSGPMHIAASLGVPTLGIYGPTDPHLQGPYGKNNLWVRNETLDCLECNLTDCPIGNVCMKDLSVDAVYTAFQQLKNINVK
jgi:lipopolysaccharide heptosyltransferase II